MGLQDMQYGSYILLSIKVDQFVVAESEMHTDSKINVPHLHNIYQGFSFLSQKKKRCIWIAMQIYHGNGKFRPIEIRISNGEK